jgi:hypothetical protein
VKIKHACMCSCCLNLCDLAAYFEKYYYSAKIKLYVLLVYIYACKKGIIKTELNAGDLDP